MNTKPPLTFPAYSLGDSHMNITGSKDKSNASSMCFTVPNKKEKVKENHHNHDGGLCGCQKGPKSHCISAIAVLFLVLLYTAMGSIIFATLEGEYEDLMAMETAVAASKPYPRSELANAEIRSRTVDRLWAITEDLNILYKENWTRLAAQEVQFFQDTLLRAARQSKSYQAGNPSPSTPTHRWTYASAFLYSLTLITTIGYGGVSPRTQWGRITALMYAVLGIPIVLLYLSAMGEALSSGMRCIFQKLRSSKSENSNRSGSKNSTSSLKNSNGGAKDIGKKLHCNDIGQGFTIDSGKQFMHSNPPPPPPGHHYAWHATKSYHNGSKKQLQSSSTPSSGGGIPVTVCVMILVCYIASGAMLFHKMQNWSVLEALYFCFTSLGTIGFGELTPTGSTTLYLASAYILVGMAVVAMCFNLIQSEIVVWLKRFSVQDHVMPQADEVTLVSVAVTPKPS